MPHKTMFTDIKNAVVNAERKLFAHFGTTLVALLLYVFLLAVLYAFLTIGERTATQVILSLLVLPLLFVILFFSLQSLGVSYTRVGVNATYLLRRALSDCWKLLIVSLPLILLAWLLHYAYGKATGKLDYDQEHGWHGTTLKWLWLFVFCLALPLMAMHLWIAAVREGIGATLRGYLGHMARAFAPRSLAVYVLAWIINGLLAYVLLFGFKTQFGGPWAELMLLGLRIALAALLVFMAWFVSLGALAEVTAPKIEPVTT
ncbi:MAG: hypothetical protein HOP19_26485 [Acidobacteria bacterium]|nr:hypothetical protein [Acidobacteriota bacterium]